MISEFSYDDSAMTRDIPNHGQRDSSNQKGGQEAILEFSHHSYVTCCEASPACSEVNEAAVAELILHAFVTRRVWRVQHRHSEQCGWKFNDFVKNYNGLSFNDLLTIMSSPRSQMLEFQLNNN